MGYYNCLTKEYQGEFKNGLYNGQGTSFYNTEKTLKKYERQWENGKKCGKGKYYICEVQYVYWHSDPKKIEEYDGEFDNDTYNGPGVFTYSNGKKYDGK